MRHFKWMQEYGIDGVFLQQFVTELKSEKLLKIIILKSKNFLRPGTTNREFRDKVQQNVLKGAEKFGREFSIMYDISGVKDATEFDRLKGK